ncbi:MAG: alkaline shock response membrane anchor protein AmaP [Limnochordaceae bacterium]|nr:alkaline shock response membrane anchor protein AmaP [Limnochordaceae bacterium]
MNTPIFDRILEGLAFLLFFALALPLGFVALGWDPTPTLVRWVPEIVMRTDARWGAGIGAIVLLLFGVYFLTRATASDGNEGSVLVGTEGGEVRISGRAVESLIYRVARQESGVREVEARLRHHPEGLGISMQLVVEPDVSIPALTSALQRHVTDYLQQTAGLKVAQVKVQVRNVANTGRAGRSSRGDRERKEIAPRQ